MTSYNQNRREFAKKTTAIAIGAATPCFFSTPRTLADETKSPNDRFRIGLIGAGGMGMGNMYAAKQWCDVVAIADVDAKRANNANHQLSGGKADVYCDYRAILDRDDYDALHIATPDHWHTKPLVEAMLAGKDVYCEKPMTLTIDEGKLIRKVAKQTGRIVQVGTQQRSTFNLFVKAIAMVAEGRVGKIKRLQAAIGGGPTSPAIPAVDVPSELNWERWLGPAPLVDYRYMSQKEGEKNQQYTNGHYDFRWWYEYSGGKLTDWGAHHVDIAMWALEANGQSPVPISVGGKSVHPVPYKDGYPTQNDRYNVATTFSIQALFPNDVELTIRDDSDNGVLIEGDQGRIFVSRNKLVGKPVEDLKENPLPEDAIQKVYKGLPMVDNERRAHWANFIHCCRERQEPISDVHSHMRALNICHLAGIAARFDRTIRWDGDTEQIVGDEQANALLARPYRKGYEIEM
ncbi:MAG: Gfo/Idh/MocA family oxidoreductase [Planctomycetes bacterium]|nr:Gfo/Idh/MocA family oxidoreductase [Planctomycetota bacterium]